MRSTIASRLSLLAITIVASSAAVALHGQSFQSSFSNITFDRAKTPATFVGNSRVDVASGAVDVQIPLGPGIGNGNLRFVPRLSGHFAPCYQSFTPSAAQQTWFDAPPFLILGGDENWAQTVIAKAAQGWAEAVQVSTGGATLSPGYLALVNDSQGCPDLISNFTLPDGSSSSIRATPPPAEVNAPAILGQFGVAFPNNLTAFPAETAGAAGRQVLMGTDGELVVALTGTNSLPIQGTLTAGQTQIPWSAPARVVVIKGDIATEFGFVNPVFGEGSSAPHQSTNNPYGKRWSYLRSGYYLPIRMSNRFGESIVFNHFHQPAYLPNYTGISGYTPEAGPVANGLNLDVIWAGSGGARGVYLKIRGNVGDLVQPPSAVPSLAGKSRSDASACNKINLTVSYVGATHSDYTLEAFPSDWTQPLPMDPANPLHQWGGGSQVSDVWDHIRRNLQPLKIEQVKLEQGATPDKWEFLYASDTTVNVSFPMSDEPTFTPTVLRGLSMPGHSTTFTWAKYPWRPNASPNSGGFSPARPFDWPSYFIGVKKVQEGANDSNHIRTTEYDRTVPTPNWSQGNTGGWTTTAFKVTVKHPGGQKTVHSFVEPPSDASTDMRARAFVKNSIQETREYAVGIDPAASPNKATIQQFDRWSMKILGDSLGQNGIPYPTRTQTLDLATGALTYAEMELWDGTAQAWRGLRKVVYNASDLEPVEFARTQDAATPPTADVTFDRSSLKTYSADLSVWLPQRVSAEVGTGRPSMSYSYPSGSSLVETVTATDGTESLRTDYTYYPAAQVKTVRVGVGTSTIGTYGFDYEYDSNGFLSQINPKGVTWSYKQSQDALGQVQTQTDPNGLVSGFAHDSAGRLTQVAPPGELATAISYPTSFQATVTRGAEASEYHYDGFGNLIRTVRKDGTTSNHKTFVFDVHGRKKQESPWIAGEGANLETVEPTSGSSWDYDARGRLATTTVPRGTARVTSTLSYTDKVVAGKSRRDVTTNGKTHSTFFDALGRIVEVRDPLFSEETALHKVTYGYNDSDRLTSVTQAGEAGTQTRTWTYNTLGWMKNEKHPETGTIVYSDFTATGQARKVNYWDGHWIITTFDALMRPTRMRSYSTIAPMVSVDQTVGYDVRDSYQAFGKRVSATNGTINLDYTYDSTTGRLKQLGTKWGTRILQEFGYDGYGRRTSATVDGRAVVTGYKASMGVPTSVSHAGNAVASIKDDDIDPVTWLPKDLTFDATGSKSLMDYAPDQASLTLLSHYPKGTGTAQRQWNFAYDSDGNLSSNGEDGWLYDELNRLKKATFKALPTTQIPDPRLITQEYTYDAFGNQLSRTGSQQGDPPSLINFTFPAANAAFLKNRIPSNDATGAAYDANGNLTQINAIPGATTTSNITMTYDALGRVVGLNYYAGTKSRKDEYLYSPDGLRIGINTKNSSGTLLKSLFNIYDDQRRLVSVYETINVAQ